MFKKNNSSTTETSINPFIRTMKGDLKAANTPAVPASLPTEKETATPTQPKNTSARPQLEITRETPRMANPAIDTSSPFYNASAESSTPKPASPVSKEKEITQASTEKIAKAPEKSPSTTTKEDISWTKLFVILSSSLIIIIALVAGYFYWQNNSVKEITLSPTEEQEPISINPVAEKYSTENPNYLQINANGTDIEIKETLKQMADNVAKLQSEVPVEFVVTDQNNSPIAFHIFAAALKLNFSQQLLDTLDDNFSLFALQDETTTRLGLAIKTKDNAIAKNEFNKNENTLPDSLKPLFLDELVIQVNVIFNESVYNNNQIRYFNIDSTKKQSIDYTVLNELLLIGTSKQTLRSIIDKAVQNQTPSTTQPIEVQTKQQLSTEIQ